MKKYPFAFQFMLCICFLAVGFGLHTTSVNATSMQSQAQSRYEKQNSCGITNADLVGRYNLNYAGNTNYVTDWIVGANNGEPGGYMDNDVYNDLNFPQYVNFSDYKKGVTQHYTQDRYGLGEISSFNSTQIKPNSSTSVIMPTNEDSEIVAAYLIWYTRDSGRLFGYYDDPVFFMTPAGGAYESVYPKHACIDYRTGNIETLLCMSADVTDIVKESGYGTYGVANIPFWYQTDDTPEGKTAGTNYGGWNLIIVEESAENPVRKVDFNIGSTYVHDGYSASQYLTDGLKTRPSGNTTGQVFFSGFLAGTTEADGNHQSIQTTIYSDTMPSALRGRTTLSGQMLKDCTSINDADRISPAFSILEEFTDNI